MEENLNNNNINNNDNVPNNIDNKGPSRAIVGIHLINRIFHIFSIVMIILSIISISSGISLCIYLLTSKDSIISEGMPLWLKILTDTSSGGRRGISIYTLALFCLDMAIYNTGALILFLFARKYFKTNIQECNPFTRNAAKRTFKLGLNNIIIGASVVIASLIAYLIFHGVFKNDPRGGVSYIGLGWSGLGVGLVFMIISLFINAAVDQIEYKRIN